MANHPLPYNPNVLQQFTDRMLAQTEQNAPIVDRVISKPEEPAPVCLPPTEDHSVTIDGLRASLADRFSPEARAERARRSLNKIGAIGDQLRDPRDDIRDTQQAARQRIGWPGTRKILISPTSRQADRLPGHSDTGPDDITIMAETTESSDTGIAGSGDEIDFANAGFSLMHGTAPWKKTKILNTNRPTTILERAAERRMARRLERSYKAGDEARWLTSSDDLTDIDSSPLSRSEKRHLRTSARKARRLQKRSEKHHRKFEKTATNSGLIGRLLGGRDGE